MTQGPGGPAKNLQMIRTFCAIAVFKDIYLWLIYFPLHKAETNAIVSQWELTPLWGLVLLCRNLQETVFPTDILKDEAVSKVCQKPRLQLKGQQSSSSNTLN